MCIRDSITLSLADLRATSTNTTNGAVRSTTGKRSGKIYFEMAGNGGAGNNAARGITTLAAALGSIGPSAIGALVYTNTGNIWINGVNTGISLGSVSLGTICSALDLVSAQIWFRINSNDWNSSPTANPAANTGGLNIAALFPTNSAYAVAVFNSVLQ